MIIKRGGFQRFYFCHDGKETLDSFIKSFCNLIILWGGEPRKAVKYKYINSKTILFFRDIDGKIDFLIEWISPYELKINGKKVTTTKYWNVSWCRISSLQPYLDKHKKYIINCLVTQESCLAKIEGKCNANVISVHPNGGCHEFYDNYRGCGDHLFPGIKCESLDCENLVTKRNHYYSSASCKLDKVVFGYKFGSDMKNYHTECRSWSPTQKYHILRKQKQIQEENMTFAEQTRGDYDIFIERIDKINKEKRMLAKLS